MIVLSLAGEIAVGMHHRRDRSAETVIFEIKHQLVSDRHGQQHLKIHVQRQLSHGGLTDRSCYTQELSPGSTRVDISSKRQLPDGTTIIVNCQKQPSEEVPYHSSFEVNTQEEKPTRRKCCQCCSSLTAAIKSVAYSVGTQAKRIFD